MTSSVFQLAIVAFCLAFGVSLLARSTSMSGTKLDTFWKMVKGRISRVKDSVSRNKDGVAMTFDPEANEGWGVCTLRSKKRLGKTSFVQYDFDLPQSDAYIPLDLGQQLTLCCLDNTQTVTKGNFYLYHGDNTDKLGTFSILAPNKTPAENVYEVGRDTARFVSNYFNFRDYCASIHSRSNCPVLCCYSGGSVETRTQSRRRSCGSAWTT